MDEVYERTQEEHGTIDEEHYSMQDEHAHRAQAGPRGGRTDKEEHELALARSTNHHTVWL